FIPANSAFGNNLLHFLFLAGRQLQMRDHVRIIDRRVRHAGKAKAKYRKEQGHESHRFGPPISGFGDWVLTTHRSTSYMIRSGAARQGSHFILKNWMTIATGTDVAALIWSRSRQGIYVLRNFI